MRFERLCKLTPFLALIGKILISLSLFLALPTYPNRNNNLAWAKAEKPYIVILDPGHGGEDTGAKATLKKKPIYEKDLTLALALRVEKVLKNPLYSKPLGRRIKVVFTRRKDKTVPLPERSKIARGVTADLYLSLHCNFEPTGKVSGLETYILKNDEASVQKLAQIQAKGELPTNQNESQDVTLLLSSVAADATMEASRQAAELIHKSVVGHLARGDALTRNRGMRQALLFVLLNAQTPAVLLEAFYMSNARDLAFLVEPENRQKIAEGIAMGILRFLALR